MDVSYKVHYHLGTGRPDRISIRIKPNGNNAAFKRLPSAFLVALINHTVVDKPTKFADLVTTFKLCAADRTKEGILQLIRVVRTHVKLFEEQLGGDRSSDDSASPTLVAAE